MKTLVEVKRFLERYQICNKTAAQLKQSLLKRIAPEDLTDEVLSRLNMHNAQFLTDVCGQPEQVEAFLKTWIHDLRKKNVPFSEDVEFFLYQLDWPRIVTRLHELKPIVTLSEDEFMTPNRKLTEIYREKGIIP